MVTTITFIPTNAITSWLERGVYCIHPFPSSIQKSLHYGFWSHIKIKNEVRTCMAPANLKEPASEGTADSAPPRRPQRSSAGHCALFLADGKSCRELDKLLSGWWYHPMLASQQPGQDCTAAWKTPSLQIQVQIRWVWEGMWEEEVKPISLIPDLQWPLLALGHSNT